LIESHSLHRKSAVTNHHHHHRVARSSRSISVCTTRCQRERLCAICQAEERPMFWVLRSPSIVRSQDWRGQPLGSRQSSGRWLERCAWSCDGSPRRIWPNSLRRRSRMVLVTWLSFVYGLSDLRHGLCRVWGKCVAGTIGQKHRDVVWQWQSSTTCQHQKTELGRCKCYTSGVWLEERWMSARYCSLGLSCRSGRARFFYGCRCRTCHLGQWMNPGRQMCQLSWPGGRGRLILTLNSSFAPINFQTKLRGFFIHYFESKN